MNESQYTDLDLARIHVEKESEQLNIRMDRLQKRITKLEILLQEFSELINESLPRPTGQTQ